MVFFKEYGDVALMDYIWLVRLVLEILKVIADMTAEERRAISQLRLSDVESEVA